MLRPFGFAQGRLAVELRLREAQSSLSMTSPSYVAKLRDSTPEPSCLIMSLRNKSRGPSRAEAQEILSALRGPEGLLFHNDSGTRSFSSTSEAVPFPKTFMR